MSFGWFIQALQRDGALEISTSSEGLTVLKADETSKSNPGTRIPAVTLFLN